MVIKQITFSDVYPIWRNFLWPERKSTIESTSAMSYLGGYNLAAMSNNPTFFGCYEGELLVGVNSGHKSMNNGYRSRGLFVLPEFRGRKIGVELLVATINQGIKEQCNYVWSYPKLNSWGTYQKAGFSLSSDFEQSELGLNAYCKKDI